MRVEFNYKIGSLEFIKIIAESLEQGFTGFEIIENEIDLFDCEGVKTNVFKEKYIQFT